MGLAITDLREIKDERAALEATLSAMQQGCDAIAQGSLEVGRWFGRPDLIRKVAKPSHLGRWSYEPYDCKLSRDTKGATILQLGLYAALLADSQGGEPDFFYVVPPGRNFEPERYRFAEYAAYYRYVRARLEKECDDGQEPRTYPEPCEHCDVCRWYRECDTKWRQDDHLSLVAGITRLQREQLDRWETDTVVKLSQLPIPLRQKPLHGSREAYERVREQARVQVDGRTKNAPVHELLPVVAGTGFCAMPEASRFDVFVDLEGDPFAAEGGRQYLFGFVGAAPEDPYCKRWSLTPADEKAAFEWMVDEIMRRWEQDPAMHVYHFGAYEPSQFKWLMGRYATREDAIDRMLRAELFVDLHTIVKQAIRASVEGYSLKALEIFHSFFRQTSLADSRAAMRYVEHALELGWDGELPVSARKTMEGYNEDDCRSTASLRNWLEEERRKREESGTHVPRPGIKDGTPSEELDERQKRVAALTSELLEDVPADPAARTGEQAARWILAQLLDWHRRENKATWWEGYRLAALDDDHLLDERVALSGLCFVKRISVERKIPTDRYEFAKQETELRADKDLYHRGQKIGSVVAIDLVARTVDIRKSRNTAATHPTSVYMWDRPYRTDKQAEALFRIGQWVRDNGMDARGSYRAARDLLLRKPPRFKNRVQITKRPAEDIVETARRFAEALDDSAFAIQGPPGAGKTYTGARMICGLVKKGKKIGITALGHKVIRKLLDEVVDAAHEGNFKDCEMHAETERR